MRISNSLITRKRHTPKPIYLCIPCFSGTGGPHIVDLSSLCQSLLPRWETTGKKMDESRDVLYLARHYPIPLVHKSLPGWIWSFPPFRRNSSVVTTVLRFLLFFFGRLPTSSRPPPGRPPFSHLSVGSWVSEPPKLLVKWGGVDLDQRQVQLADVVHVLRNEEERDGSSGPPKPVLPYGHPCNPSSLSVNPPWRDQKMGPFRRSRDETSTGHDVSMTSRQMVASFRVRTWRYWRF